MGLAKSINSIIVCSFYFYSKNDRSLALSYLHAPYNIHPVKNKYFKKSRFLRPSTLISIYVSEGHYSVDSSRAIWVMYEFFIF